MDGWGLSKLSQLVPSDNGFRDVGNHDGRHKIVSSKQVYAVGMWLEDGAGMEW